MAFSKLILISMMLSITNTQMQILRESYKYSADCNIVLENIFDSGSVLKRVSGKGRRQCFLECTSYFPCESVIDKNDGGSCELLDQNLTSSADVLHQSIGWAYITTDEYSLEVRTVFLISKVDSFI